MPRRKRTPDVDMTDGDIDSVPPEDTFLIEHVEDEDEGDVRKVSWSSVEERARIAFSMRMTGATYKVIGDALGITVSSAHNDVRRVIEELPKEDLRILRQTHHARLEQLLATRWVRAIQGDDAALAPVLAILDRLDRLHGISYQPGEEEREHDVAADQIIVLQGSTTQFRGELEAAKKRAAQRDS
jgi:hypothetical protein